MPRSSRKFLVGLVLFLLTGALVGWRYGHPGLGLLIAALVALLWQVSRLLSFNRALHTGDFDAFRYGDGIWQQLFSRFNYEHERGTRYKHLHRQAIKAIRRSTNAMPDGAVILDDSNEILICNRAAKSLTGLKRKKDRGQRIDNILRDPGLTRLLEQDDAALTVDIASPVQEGGWLNCRVVPYGGDQKLLMLRDVTEVMALNKMRRDFVANASHELRSPLTVMSGYLDTMSEDTTLSPGWRKPLQRMREQAARMTQIITELLELSRLEGGGSATNDELVDVIGLLESARNSHLDETNAAAIEIEAESAAQLRGNRSEIESVITNLLSNALRHTGPDGRIVLAWRADPCGADLVVEDTGEGIAEEYIPRLTERFFRVDRGRARGDGGIGLGLAIVKHALGRHQAELIVTSKPGVGSEFRCRFPAARVVVDAPITQAGGRAI